MPIELNSWIIHFLSFQNVMSGSEGPTGWRHQGDGSEERLRPQSSGESRPL